MIEKFGAPESEVRLKVGDLVSLDPKAPEHIKTILKGYIEEGEVYKIYHLSYSDEDDSVVAYIGPIDLDFDLEKYEAASDLEAEMDKSGIRPMALNLLKQHKLS